MTRGAAISIALLAFIAVALIVLHSASSPAGAEDLAGMTDPRVTKPGVHRLVEIEA
jgi:hypothetical protein